ncbi:hypothetical protein CTEN210_15677 [Chaetoceros tenuissimus]|uniref:Uncharacterized protein n=1 Tax=Chaetoceros tenuissimus TaxID=426638 RepID=A0AAD3D7D7_9STRA|nr:hypothetical protein CTEN210_15677 [Chaetoceros tenuissimus]
MRHAVPALLVYSWLTWVFRPQKDLGIVVEDIATAATVGSCSPGQRIPLVAFDGACKADTSVCKIIATYACPVLGGKMESPTVGLGLTGTILMVILLFTRLALLSLLEPEVLVYLILVMMHEELQSSTFKQGCRYRYKVKLVTRLLLSSHYCMLISSMLPKLSLLISFTGFMVDNGNLLDSRSALVLMTSYIENATGVDALFTGLTPSLCHIFLFLFIFY